MSHPMNPAIEMAIEAAQRADDFRDLPGAGKPLEFLSRPKDAVIDHILKENRAVPLAVSLKNKISELHKTLKAETDEAARKALMTEIAAQQLRLDLEIEALGKYG